MDSGVYMDFYTEKQTLARELEACRSALMAKLEQIKAAESSGSDMRTFVPWLKKWLADTSGERTNEATLLKQLQKISTARLGEREKLLTLGLLLGFRKQKARYDALLIQYGYSPLDPETLSDAVLLAALGCPEAEEEKLVFCCRAAEQSGLANLKQLTDWMAATDAVDFPARVSALLGAKPGREGLTGYAVAAGLDLQAANRLLAWYGLAALDPDRLRDRRQIHRLQKKPYTEFECCCEQIMAKAGKECGSDSVSCIQVWLDNQENQDLLWEDCRWDNTRLSLRFKLLAFAVVCRWGVAETQEKLASCHLESLYRSAEDIGILRGLSKNDHARLCGDNFADADGICRDIIRISRIAANREVQFPTDEKIVRAKAQNGGSRGTRGITLWCLEEYLSAGEESSSKVTRQYTREFLSELCPSLDSGKTNEAFLSDDAFYERLKAHPELIAATRSRTRRELIKQLRFYFQTLIFFGRVGDTGDINAVNHHPVFANVTVNQLEPYAFYLHCPINFTALCYDLDEFLRQENPRIDRYLHGRSEIPYVDVKTPADILSGAIRGENDITRTFLISIVCFLHGEINEMRRGLNRKNARTVAERILNGFQDKSRKMAAFTALFQSAGLPVPLSPAASTEQVSDKWLHDAVHNTDQTEFTDACLAYAAAYLRRGMPTIAKLNEILNKCGWYEGLSPESYVPEFNYDRLAYLLMTDECRLEREAASGEIRWMRIRSSGWSSYLGELYSKAGVASLRGTAALDV